MSFIRECENVLNGCPRLCIEHTSFIFVIEIILSLLSQYERTRSANIKHDFHSVNTTLNIITFRGTLETVMKMN